MGIHDKPFGPFLPTRWPEKSTPMKVCYSLKVGAACLAASLPSVLRASEADIKIPDLTQVRFYGLGGLSGLTLMYIGIAVCFVGAVFGLLQYRQTKALPVHSSM